MAFVGQRGGGPKPGSFGRTQKGWNGPVGGNRSGNSMAFDRLNTLARTGNVGNIPNWGTVSDFGKPKS
jgi:hypothetical protein